MAAMVGAIVGSLFHHTLAGLAIAAAFPLAHCVKTLVQRKLRHREAVRNLTDPGLIRIVQEYNAELLRAGQRYELRTPRKIQTLHVLHKPEATLIHLDYPQWFPKDDPAVEAFVKKARPC